MVPIYLFLLFCKYTKYTKRKNKKNIYLKEICFVFGPFLSGLLPISVLHLKHFIGNITEAYDEESLPLLFQHLLFLLCKVSSLQTLQNSTIFFTLGTLLTLTSFTLPTLTDAYPSNEDWGLSTPNVYCFYHFLYLFFFQSGLPNIYDFSLHLTILPFLKV